MIKNVVFDMGNVLVTYDPTYFLKDYPEEEKTLFLKEIYLSEAWKMLDRGELSEEELIRLVCSRIDARHHADARKLIRWYDLSAPIDGMEQLVRQLKEHGYAVYLLSNTSKAFYGFSKNIPALAYFDGRFISADHGILKPDREIFRLFCSKFALNAAESVFIDDAPANVEAAAAEGFSGIVFAGDAAKLANALVDLEIAL